MKIIKLKQTVCLTIAIFFSLGNLTNCFSISSDENNNQNEKLANLEFQTALKYDEQGELKKSFEWIEKSANHGKARAQYIMGEKYHSGIDGSPMNQSKAIAWLQKSANQNFVKAQYRLGEIYYSGDGVTKNYKKALDWYTKAAKNGYSKAQYDLGMMYYYGIGAPKNMDLAKKWIHKSKQVTKQYSQD